LAGPNTLATDYCLEMKTSKEDEQFASSSRDQSFSNRPNKKNFSLLQTKVSSSHNELDENLKYKEFSLSMMIMVITSFVFIFLAMSFVLFSTY
jgi:hypothetical protein